MGLENTNGMRFHDEAWIQSMLSPLVVCGLPVLYVASVLLGAFYMRTREPFGLKGVMRVYNVVQIVTCTYMTIGLLPVVEGFWNPFGIDSAYDKQGEWFVFLHHLSKYLDWCDTLFIVLKRKRSQMSFLHIYHHATIGPVWGYLCMTGHSNGTIRYGAMINSLTHVFMYSHYLMTSYGIRNPLKAWLTRWQIMQFYSCFMHACLVYFTSWETQVPSNLALLQFVYQLTMIYLFSFKMNYVPSCVPDSYEETQRPRIKKMA